MNIKCLLNKHDYVPIQYVDETTDYEWTYIVHCSRCHKESVHLSQPINIYKERS
jgi:hypothetical protein